MEKNQVDHINRVLDVTEQFVKALHADVVDESIDSYMEMYSGMDSSTMRNQQGIEKVSYYQSLSDNDRRIFKMFVQEIMVDTVSHVLGVLDGTTGLAQYDGEATVLLDDVETESELQDLFLRYAEERRTN